MDFSDLGFFLICLFVAGLISLSMWLFFWRFIDK